VSSLVLVSSVRPPAFGWPCPTCGDRRPFDCAERFRANTNGKLVDIWSIHRCRVCDATKNLAVVSRTPVRRVPSALLRAAEQNDAAAARACARDVALLKRNGMSVVDGDDWALDGKASDRVRLVFPEPLLLRLDHVVAAVFEMSRRDAACIHVDAHHRTDKLRLWSGEVRAARAPRPPA
jgi:hypothetical protein